MATTATHIWKPSHARLITIDSFVPVPRGSAATAPQPLNWPAKDPGDVLDYVLEIGPAITGNESDAIATLDVTIAPSQPGDLVLQSMTTDGSRIIVWLSGGQSTTIYTITFAIVTVGGRSLCRTVVLPVLSLAVSQSPANAIVTATGVALTDQNGNPILYIS